MAQSLRWFLESVSTQDDIGQASPPAIHGGRSSGMRIGTQLRTQRSHTFDLVGYLASTFSLAQGMSVDPADPVVTAPAFFVPGGPWVRPSPGIPCALCFQRATVNAKLGQIMSRECGVTPPLSCSAKAEHPVRRDLSAQAKPPLEYWIARSSRAMTPSELFDRCKSKTCSVCFAASVRHAARSAN
jgi:hypothetical protein